ncbi:MAG: hypothetical protein HYV63_14275 [Candidatus Schekmanbacteria bacterium]|nr:hypothetical protein [Candidatus Schekmanbacteria bacterium]
MTVFRGVLKESLANPGGTVLRAENGKEYDLYFSRGAEPKNSIGKNVSIRGKLRSDMMGIGMGPILEVERIEES